jgi:hypothetical protein
MPECSLLPATTTTRYAHCKEQHAGMNISQKYVSSSNGNESRNKRVIEKSNGSRKNQTGHGKIKRVHTYYIKRGFLCTRTAILRWKSRTDLFKSLINLRLTQDRLLTDRFKYRSKAITPRLVECTWQGRSKTSGFTVRVDENVNTWGFSENGAKRQRMTSHARPERELRECLIAPNLTLLSKTPPHSLYKYAGMCE